MIALTKNSLSKNINNNTYIISSISIFCGIYIICIPFLIINEMDYPSIISTIMLIIFGLCLIFLGGIKFILKDKKISKNILKGNFKIKRDVVTQKIERTHYNGDFQETEYLLEFNNIIKDKSKCKIVSKKHFVATNIGDNFFLVFIEGNDEVYTFPCKEYQLSSELQSFLQN